MNIQQYETRHKAALSVIQRMESDLKKYQERPDHNKQYVERQNEMFGVLYDFCIESATLCSALIDCMNHEYKRGYDTGREHEARNQQRKEKRKEHSFYNGDKEAIRSASKFNVTITWPELF